MNILQNFTARLNRPQLEQLIRDSIAQSNPDMTIKSIRFNASLENNDYMERGPGTPTFTGVEIVLERTPVGLSKDEIVRALSGSKLTR